MPAAARTGLLLLPLILQLHFLPTLSISPPDCHPETDTICIGHPPGVFAAGSSTAEVLEGLHAQFCGCTHVEGNININMAGLNSELTANDFSMFYYLQEISGFLQFQGINEIDEILIPDLRIIRGESLLGSTYALSMKDSGIHHLILPRLTEITHGGVLFQNVLNICSYRNVNWLDIIDDDSGMLVEIDACENFMDRLEELLSCSACDPGNCWSEEHCQNITKLSCPCGENRCYNNGVQCCNPLCAAGCDGPFASNCSACKSFLNNGTCVEHCPPRTVYDPATFTVNDNPAFRLAAGDLCLEECPSGFFVWGDVCVTECPELFFSEHGECFPCDGACPTECAGLIEGDILDKDNIAQFEGCNIISSGQLTIGDEFSSNYSHMEVLSTIEEINGPLRIQNFRGTTLPYLRNLQRVGSANATVRLPFDCEGDVLGLAFFSNPNLVEIDLSSLEEIRGSTLAWGNNFKLCFSGNLSALVVNTSLNQCVGNITSRRRDPQLCIADMLECHPECASRSLCWGSADHHCDACLNYQFVNRCVPNCSTITLPSNHSGLFQNEVNKECELCDEQCVGGCNGLGPDKCTACRNLFLEIREEGSEELQTLCVGECPLGTYLTENSLECFPCHEHCTGLGCAGSLPFIDLQDGCLECDLVQLHRNESQAQCLNRLSGCPTDHFRTTASLQVAGSTDSVVVEVCKLCDDLCASCFGEGNTTLTCQCKYASRGIQCVEECNTQNEFEDPTNHVCMLCASACSSCDGPSVTDCFDCATGFVKEFTDNNRQSFICREECNPEDFVSADNVCESCDPLCDGCYGPDDDQCKACKDTRFQILLENAAQVETYQCFDCAVGETLNANASMCVSADPVVQELTGGQISGIVLGLLVLLLFITAIIMLIGYLWRRSKFTTAIIDKERGHMVNPTYGELGRISLEESMQPPQVAPNQARLVVTPESALDFGKVLGSGAFGTVYDGYWQPENDVHRYHVAIKVLNEGTAAPTASKELLQEGIVMASMDNENVVRLYAVCMGKQLMLISQFVPLGSLLSYLKENQDSLNALSMLTYSVQIAKGMAYLEEKRMVHRDLAARNVLVQSPLCVKITDFGLTRIIEVGESHYTAQGGKVPVRWLAPESLRNKVYTHKSDVWSFGVTIWEILTFGARPYQGKKAREIYQMLESGVRLEQPATCTIEVYAILLECWLREPETRPCFNNLVSRLEELLGDPLRYILTTRDGLVETYSALPSNLTASGEFTYENPLIFSPLPPPSAELPANGTVPRTPDYGNLADVHTTTDYDNLRELANSNPATMAAHNTATFTRLESSMAESLQRPSLESEASLSTTEYGYRARKPSNYEEPLSPDPYSPDCKKDDRYISTPKIHPELGDERPHDYSYIDEDGDKDDRNGYEDMDMESFEQTPLPAKEEQHEYDYMDTSTVALGNGSVRMKHPNEYEMPAATPRGGAQRRNKRRGDRERYSPAPTSSALNEKKLSTINISPSNSESECYQGVADTFRQPANGVSKKGACAGIPDVSYEVPVDARRKVRTFASPPRALPPDEYDVPMDAMSTL